MKLVHARLRAPNFGDDLNLWMWPRLLPGVFDEDESTRFLGIGSIISDRFGGAGRKVVMGAAFVPEYERLPDLTGGDWRFYFVRGPRSARALGLDAALGVGDAAILMRALVPQFAGASGRGAVAFIPHWESLEWGFWPEACRQAGVVLIDSRWPVERVLAAIAASRLVLCEAMHGAVVSDALRVPWAPFLPVNPRHRAKWRDWAEALDMDLRPLPLAPSCLAELLPRMTRRTNVVYRARAMLGAWPLAPVRAVTIRLAAAGLAAAAALPGQLSHEATLDRAVGRMLEAVETFKTDLRLGRV